MKAASLSIIFALLVSGCVSVTGDSALTGPTPEPALDDVMQDSSLPVPVQEPEMSGAPEEETAPKETPEKELAREDPIQEPEPELSPEPAEEDSRELGEESTQEPEESPEPAPEEDPEPAGPDENPPEEQNPGNETEPEEPAPSPLLGHLIFSEIFYDTPGKDAVEEWIKLYNPLPEEIDLSGYSIQDKTRAWQFPNGSAIPPESCLVVARNSIGFQNLTGCMPGLAGFTRPLSNSGDVLILRDGQDEIDRVSWEGFEPGWDISASEGKSLRRNSIANDTDSPDDWSGEQEPEPC